jgi:hypothetical protein
MEVAKFVKQTSMREITFYLVVKKMSQGKKKLRGQGTLKERLQAEVTNSKGNLSKKNRLDWLSK